jgi:N-acetylglutamate synthase-like GNAT family acetyltransferase
MIIEYLADHRDVIPTIARWSYEEWSYLHPERTLSDVKRLISEGSNKEQIPISLVAIDKGKVIGWIALKTSDFKPRPDLSPWLAGLYVDKPQRRKGVGTKLVHEIEKLAARLGVSKLYLVTDNAEKFYSKLGWSVLERTVSQGISVIVLEKDIARLR